MKKIDKIIMLTEIVFFIFIILCSLYLKQRNYLCSIDFSNPTQYFDDQTLYILEYNTYQNILIVFSFGILLIYIIIYCLKKSKYKLDFFDNVYLIYFIVNFLIYFMPKYAFANYGDSAQVAVLFSSFTFLQTNFANIVPYGCILYVPLIYLFFIKKDYIFVSAVKDNIIPNTKR